MVIFNQLFGLASKYKKVAKEFHQSYCDMYELVRLLREELVALRKMQEDLVNSLSRSGVKFAGHASLSKTKAILDTDTKKPEGLVPELERLEFIAEKRFKKAQNKYAELILPNPEERLEIEQVLDFLRKAHELLIDVDDIKKQDNARDQLGSVEKSLKEISELFSRFYQVKKYGIQKKVLEDYESIKLLDEVYYNSKKQRFCPKGHPVDQKGVSSHCAICGEKTTSVLEYRLGKSELEEFERQAEHLNAHNDPDNRVIWRRWWRSKQLPEVDVGTGYREEHINVWLKIHGGKKKNIHLVAA